MTQINQLPLEIQALIFGNLDESIKEKVLNSDEQHAEEKTIEIQSKLDLIRLETIDSKLKNYKSVLFFKSVQLFDISNEKKFHTIVDNVLDKNKIALARNDASKLFESGKGRKAKMEDVKMN